MRARFAMMPGTVESNAVLKIEGRAGSASLPSDASDARRAPASRSMLKWRGGSPTLVKRHHAGAAEAEIVLEREARAFHLRGLSRAAQLARQLVALRQPGR